MDADFSSVWSRVTGVRPPEDELTRLRRWMGDETRELHACEELLRGHLPAPVRDTLTAVLRVKRRDLKELQTMYYLRTGDSWPQPKPEKRKRETLMNALRERYAASMDMADGYRGCASERRDLSSLCAELAENEEANARKLRGLIKRLL